MRLETNDRNLLLFVLGGDISPPRRVFDLFRRKRQAEVEVVSCH